MPNFVEATVNLMNSNLSGTYHLVGSDFINEYKWPSLVCDVFGFDKKLIKPINSKQLNLPAKKGKD